MKDVLQLLGTYAATYQGQGTNHEGQPFTGRLTLKPLLGGAGFSLQFQAAGADGTSYHAEESMIAPSIQEKLTLWNFNTNTPGLIAHDLRATTPRAGAAHSFIFGFGDTANMQSFREEIAIDLWANGDFSYTYSWGMPGGNFQERSGVRMKRL